MSTAPAADPFWARVQELFLAAADLPHDERPAFFASIEDPRMRAEVESLLHAHEASGSFLDGSAWELLDLDRAEDLSGKTIGGYKLVRPLGEGGMGTVFLAVRDDPSFDKRVALKMIRGGATASLVVRRFQQERKILAALQHPNIATLFDGGTTADGMPFLVMEYVDGTPIDRYCAERRLSTSERLRLFLTLADAVQYAHRNLIVHRDIKPANVLITSVGEVKLLDFGIAKLTSADTARADATATRLMTPDYASPEQLRGEAVSTSTDVYSLGVLLYELLTGSLPFERPRRVESEPARPSARNRALRGDLENILLMALADDPAQRYGSVERFAEDIRRYLGGLPVLAHRGSLAYRTAKFVRRNKIAVAAALVVIVVTAIAFSATVRQKRIAERRFGEVRALARSIVFELHDAIAPLPGSTRPREILVRRALEYLDRLSNEASDNTPLEMELASTYLRVGDVQGLPYQANLGDTAGAMSSYGKALRIARGVTEREPENQEALALLADAHDRAGFVAQRELRWAVAFREHSAALAARRRIAAPGPRGLLALSRTYVSLGDCYHVGHREVNVPHPNAAQEAYESSLRVLERVPPQGPHRGELLDAIGRGNQRLGGLFSHPRLMKLHGDRCVRYHLAALRALEEHHRIDPSNAKARRNYADQLVMTATAHIRLRNGADAFASSERAVAIFNELTAADPTNAEAQHDLAFGLENAGSALALMQRYDEAMERYLAALAILERLVKNDPRNREDLRGISGVLSRMSELEQHRGNPAAALALKARAEAARAELARRGSPLS